MNSEKLNNINKALYYEKGYLPLQYRSKIIKPYGYGFKLFKQKPKTIFVESAMSLQQYFDAILIKKDNYRFNIICIKEITSEYTINNELLDQCYKACDSFKQYTGYLRRRQIPPVMYILLCSDEDISDQSKAMIRSLNSNARSYKGIVIKFAILSYLTGNIISNTFPLGSPSIKKTMKRACLNPIKEDIYLNILSKSGVNKLLAFLCALFGYSLSFILIKFIAYNDYKFNGLIVFLSFILAIAASIKIRFIVRNNVEQALMTYFFYAFFYFIFSPLQNINFSFLFVYNIIMLLLIAYGIGDSYPEYE